MSYPNAITFFAAGVPVAKGSAKAFYNKRAGRAFVVQDNSERQRPWASTITHEAIAAGLRPAEGAVFVSMRFLFPRPKKHYRGKAMELRDNAPEYHTSTPDVDKCVRLVLDALTGVAWQDDKQAQIGLAVKRYAMPTEMTGVCVTIRREPVEWDD
jgi:crossover junction endodeoxyribonuclease RusA